MKQQHSTGKHTNSYRGIERRRLALRPRSPIGRSIERFSSITTAWAGTSWAFMAALLVVLLWIFCGPLFDYSNTWQLVINTTTTIVTFLMVFLIQRAQNKESLAIQLKLNEIVAALKGASNRLIDIEDLSEEELITLHEHFRRLAKIAGKDEDLRTSHSIEEAERRHSSKHSS